MAPGKEGYPKEVWDKVEAAYRHTSLSLQKIHKKYGPAAPTIVKKAKLKHWIRDPDARVSNPGKNSAQRAEGTALDDQQQACREQKHLANRLRDLANLYLDQVHIEIQLRDRETRSTKTRKLRSGRPENIVKILGDTADLLARLVKIEKEIYAVAPNARPETGAGTPVAKEAPAPAREIPLSERLNLMECQDEIKRAQAEHRRHDKPEEKVVKLGSGGQ